MKPRTLLFIATLSTLIFTGCQNNDLSAQNQALKLKIAELQQQTSSNASISSNEISASVYTMEELAEMVDEFVVSVGSATPDVNNSGNLDQFFSLKREGDQIEHALENRENSLEDQYRSKSISKEEYRKLDREIEKLEEFVDSAKDRLEISFGIDD